MDIQTAVFIGLVIGSPLAMVAGCYLALGLTVDMEEHATAKVLGWLLCAPFALVFGALTGQHVFFLIPEHWHPAIATGLATPYGFITCWWLVVLMCRHRPPKNPQSATNPRNAAKRVAEKIFNAKH